jgi:ArsR family metal-binding transcriptional regulator
MAYVVVFPDQETFQQSLRSASLSERLLKVLQPPEFCRSLVAPSILITGIGGARTPAEIMAVIGVPASGVLRYAAFKKVVPKAPSPDPRWNEIMGLIRIESVGPCVSDELRLRLEVTWERSLTHLVQFMARVIRGGSYRPEAATLVFEEEHRLLAVSSHRLVVCRADDLLDAWIQLRSFVDLVCATSDRQALIKPETTPRRGIGSVEIFRWLPGTNCGRCGYPNCMELAMGLFMGHGRIEECALLFEPKWARHREALMWLLDLIGPCPRHENEEAATPLHK